MWGEGEAAPHLPQLPQPSTIFPAESSFLRYLTASYDLPVTDTALEHALFKTSLDSLSRRQPLAREHQKPSQSICNLGHGIEKAQLKNAQTESLIFPAAATFCLCCDNNFLHNPIALGPGTQRKQRCKRGRRGRTRCVFSFYFIYMSSPMEVGTPMSSGICWDSTPLSVPKPSYPGGNLVTIKSGDSLLPGSNRLFVVGSPFQHY